MCPDFVMPLCTSWFSMLLIEHFKTNVQKQNMSSFVSIDLKCDSFRQRYFECFQIPNVHRYLKFKTLVDQADYHCRHRTLGILIMNAQSFNGVLKWGHALIDKHYGICKVLNLVSRRVRTDK